MNNDEFQVKFKIDNERRVYKLITYVAENCLKCLMLEKLIQENFSQFLVMGLKILKAVLSSLT